MTTDVVKKRFCITNINNLTYEQKRDVGNIILTREGEDKIRDSSAGCIIDLDKVSSDTLDHIYNFISRKLDPV